MFKFACGDFKEFMFTWQKMPLRTWKGLVLYFVAVESVIHS